MASLVLASALFSEMRSVLQDSIRSPIPLQHDVTVVNIAVPTRVFDGDRFGGYIKQAVVTLERTASS